MKKQIGISANYGQDGLLNFLESIPNTDTSTIKIVNIYVTNTNGVILDTHELRQCDSICSLLFDLSLAGGCIAGYSYNLFWSENDWNRLNVCLDIEKTGKGNTNITADVIETLLVKLGFMEEVK